MTSWGIFNQLVEKRLVTQRQIVEAAATQADKQADPFTHTLGLLDASGMEETTIEAAGDQPIRPPLEAIAAPGSSVPLPPHPTLQVDGRLTLGENIADPGGIHSAYDAVQTALRTRPERAQTIDGDHPEQRFFLDLARNWRGQIRRQQELVNLASDPHSPSKLRAIASPSNMPQFATAFSCKPGDAMVRPDKDRVVIW